MAFSGAEIFYRWICSVLDVFVEQGIKHIFVCSGGGRLVVGQKGHVERADGVILDNLLHGADVVCVRVRGDNGIERCDAERLKVAFVVSPASRVPASMSML